MTDKGRILNSGLPAQQKTRFSEVIKKWKIASAENETFSLSDTNINLNTYSQTPEQMSLNDRKQIHLLKILKDELLQNGSTFIKTKNTRFNHQSGLEDFLDHMITNTPQKVINHQIHQTGDSDHHICEFTIKTTSTPFFPKYILRRDYEKVDWDNLKIFVKFDHRQAIARNSKDPLKLLLLSKK